MGRKLSAALGFAGKPDELAALRKVTTADLLSVGDPEQRLFQTSAAYTYQPYVDGWVLPKNPVNAFADGDFRHVPVTSPPSSGRTARRPTSAGPSSSSSTSTS